MPKPRMSVSPERRLPRFHLDRFSPVKVCAPRLWCEHFCAVRNRSGTGLNVAIEFHLDAVRYGACEIAAIFSP